MFAAIKALFGLRIPAEVEEIGIDAVYHGMASYPEFTGKDDTPLDLNLGGELAAAD